MYSTTSLETRKSGCQKKIDGKLAKPEILNPEARRAECEGGVLGKGRASKLLSTS